MGHLQIPGVLIRDLGGNTSKESRMRVRVNELPGGIPPPVVAVVADADHDPAEARDAWNSALKNVAPGSQTSVFLLPDNANPGMIEDLCFQISKNEALKECIGGFVRCVASLPIGGVNRSKLAFDAYQSVIDRTQRGIPKAVQNQHFDWESPHLSPLVEFLKAL